MLKHIPLLLALLLLSACGYTTSTGSTSPSASPSPAASPSPTPMASPSPSPVSSPSPSPIASPSPNPSPSPSASHSPSPVALTCTPTGAASADWPAASSASASPAITAAVISGNTLVLTFLQGTPQFNLTSQTSSVFYTDPQGATITLAGTNGVHIILAGFRGDISNYTLPTSQTSSGPLLKQVYKLGDFEGVVTFGAGTSVNACAHVTASANTLTFQFIPA